MVFSIVSLKKYTKPPFLIRRQKYYIKSILEMLEKR